MGGCGSLQRGGEDGFKSATLRAEGRLGKLTVSSRYHRLPRRFRDDYKLESAVLGTGCSGQVHLAKSRHKDSSARRYAAKCLRLAGLSNERRQELAAEAEIFLGMDHPYVARLVDAYESDEQLVLIMECLTGGDIFRRTEEKRFTDREAASAVRQMVVALNYLHTHGIVHRDIKLENFLYDSPGSSQLKLIDFGLSKVLDPDMKMSLSCGTLSYMAPEVLQRSYTSQCDLWSLGVASFVLVFGYMPFSGSEKRQVQNIKAAKFQVKKRAFAEASPDARDFVHSLLVADPDVRLTAEKALEHTWLADNADVAGTAMDAGVVDALSSFGQLSAFRRAGLMMVAWSLSIEECAKVSQEFLKMDLGHSGAIQSSEFKQVLEEQFQIAGHRAEEIFQALDFNGDQEIRYSNFIAATASLQIRLHDDHLKAAFRRFDVEGTGFVTLSNLQDVLGESFGGQEVCTMLKEVSTSQDGSISRDEFVTHFRGKGRSVPAAPPLEH